MKIQLPNPSDYQGKEDMFWEQLELSLYHAKKSWQKVKRTYSEQDKENYPWLSFSLGIDKGEVSNFLDSEKIDPDYKDRQEISIEINEM